MINTAIAQPPFCTGLQSNSYSHEKAENILENIKTAQAQNGQNFGIKINNHSTVSLLLIIVPKYFFQQEQRITSVLYVDRNSTLLWVDRIVEFSGKGMEDAALKEIAEITTKLKVSHGESQISAGFSQLLKHDLPDIVAIALLRNTFFLRSKVPYWEDFLLTTESALSAKGKDPKRLLRGLKK